MIKQVIKEAITFSEEHRQCKWKITLSQTTSTQTKLLITSGKHQITCSAPSQPISISMHIYDNQHIERIADEMSDTILSFKDVASLEVTLKASIINTTTIECFKNITEKLQGALQTLFPVIEFNGIKVKE